MNTDAGYRERCDGCGRFVGRDGDSYVNWGHAGMDEPPDPTVLCGRCAKRDYQTDLAHMLRFGITPYDARPTWVPSQGWLRARRVARSMFTHGLAVRPVVHRRVRYETSGTTQVRFCACGRPERHPAHDATEARRLRVRWCNFEWRYSRNIGTFKCQEWCACGWTTGAHPAGIGHPRLTDYLGAGELMREHLAPYRTESLPELFAAVEAAA